MTPPSSWPLFKSPPPCHCSPIHHMVHYYTLQSPPLTIHHWARLQHYSPPPSMLGPLLSPISLQSPPSPNPLLSPHYSPLHHMVLTKSHYNNTVLFNAWTITKPPLQHYSPLHHQVHYWAPATTLQSPASTNPLLSRAKVPSITWSITEPPLNHHSPFPSESLR